MRRLRGEAVTAPALADIYKFIRKLNKRKRAPGEKISPKAQDDKRIKSSRFQGSACPAKSLRDLCGELPSGRDAQAAAAIATPVAADAETPRIEVADVDTVAVRIHG